jgi:hypothetical protein
MKDMEEAFCRFGGRMFLTHNEKHYGVREVKTSGQTEGMQEQTFVCNEIGSTKQSVFKMTGIDLYELIHKALTAEQETGFTQVVLIDVDKREWKAYPITPELQKQFPFLKDKVDYIT